MKIGTLFSGGLAAPEFALKYLGIDYEVVFACEWDKYARKQYLHFHGEPNAFYNDVCEMDGTPYKGKVDLMVWGSPCQDLSLAGKRKGFDGVKSSLFREGARIMSEVMPQYFIFENVKGLLSSNGGADYKEVIKTFQDMGYLIASEVLNTKDFSVPQNRERVFVVGFLDNEKYMSFKFPNKEPLHIRLKHILEDEVDEKYFLSEKMIDGFTVNNKSDFNFEPHSKEDKTCKCLTARYFKMGKTDPYIKEPQLNQIGHIKNNSQGQRVYDTQCYGTLSSQGGGMGAKTGLYQVKSATTKGYETATEEDSINFTFPESKTRRGRVGKGVAQTLDTACNQGVITLNNPKHSQQRIYSIDGISPTLCAGESGGGQNPCKHLTEDYRIRRLTPKEAFRLQGVKDEDISLVVSDSQAYKIAGNAITVLPMMRLIDNIVNPKNYGTLF